MPNRLSTEASPYLQQHKDNPVDWHPWGGEALTKALDEDKPIFLSIGYSSCHWCHVMEHESFEDQATADLLNEHFISIKVDREERPDIDSLYMTAVQALTGHGGWPLSAFLTPSLVPFYGGTYWPSEERTGMPAFKNVLVAVADAYRDKREEVEHNAGQVRKLLTATSSGAPKSGVLSKQILDEGFAALAGQFDNQNGGFGSAPKFPQASLLEFLARRHSGSEQPATARMLRVTLDHMAQGGMYDQIGGGFHRYSVDATWLVPHFEKMLYDNAQLARVYLDGFRLLGEKRHGDVAGDILDYVLREMTGPQGEFFSTQDADTEGEEGRFYVWTLDDLEQALEPANASIARAMYGVTPEGNFEGSTIPTRGEPLGKVAGKVGLSEKDLEMRIPVLRERMLAWRLRRTNPGRDEKVIASWNGMMLRAFAEAAWTLKRPDLLKTARRNGVFLRDQMIRDDGLVHVYQDGSARIPGFLEDYANVIDGFIALYQADFDAQWIELAVKLTNAMISRFEDEHTGLLFDSSSEHEPLVSRARDIQDGATPAGNTVAAETMIKLGRLTGNRELEQRGAGILGHLVRPMAEQPMGFGRALVALDTYLSIPKEVVIAGPRNGKKVASFVEAIYSAYEPHLLIGLADPKRPEDVDLLPFLAQRPMRNKAVAAYVCEHFACLPPVTDAAELSGVIKRGTGISWSEF
ncbi:thioredoxin domain-containing protein [soil metagenome]